MKSFNTKENGTVRQRHVSAAVSTRIDLASPAVDSVGEEVFSEELEVSRRFLKEMVGCSRNNRREKFVLP